MAIYTLEVLKVGSGRPYHVMHSDAPFQTISNGDRIHMLDAPGGMDAAMRGTPLEVDRVLHVISEQDGKLSHKIVVYATTE